MIKVPFILINILKKLGIYIFLKSIYYKYFRFFKFTKDNLENNLFYLFLDMSDDIQFLDVGAYKGGKIDIILNIDFKSKVIALEPFEKYFLNLKRKYKNNNNIKIINNAVSAKNEISLFYYSKNEIHKEAFSLDKTQNLDLSKKIQTVSIDNLLKNKKVSIIKIDVEGHEMMVLRGMQKSFNCKPTLFIEVTNLTFREVKNFLLNKNYYLFVYEYNFFKKKKKNNWELSNVIKNNEFDKIIYSDDYFDNIDLDFMFNIIAVHESKVSRVKKIQILENHSISSKELFLGSKI